VSTVRYERGFYIPEDDILHSHRRRNLESYIRFYCFQLNLNTLSLSRIFATAYFKEKFKSRGVKASPISWKRLFLVLEIVCY
jgi:hypothetical protein